MIEYDLINSLTIKYRKCSENPNSGNSNNVRNVNLDGSLNNNNAYNGNRGVRFDYKAVERKNEESTHNYYIILPKSIILGFIRRTFSSLSIKAKINSIYDVIDYTFKYNCHYYYKRKFIVEVTKYKLTKNLFIKSILKYYNYSLAKEEPLNEIL